MRIFFLQFQWYWVIHNSWFRTLREWAAQHTQNTRKTHRPKSRKSLLLSVYDGGPKRPMTVEQVSYCRRVTRIVGYGYLIESTSDFYLSLDKLSVLTTECSVFCVWCVFCYIKDVLKWWFKDIMWILGEWKCFSQERMPRLLRSATLNHNLIVVQQLDFSTCKTQAHLVR